MEHNENSIFNKMKKTRLHCNDFLGYAFHAPAKSGAGRGNPEFLTAHNRAFAVFLCVKHGHIRIMVGRAGQPKGWPGSVGTGISTPVRLTTSQVVESLGGELSKLPTEAAIMATVPTLDLSFAAATPDLQIVNGQVLTTSLAVAAFFQRDHRNVLRSIKELLCTEKFTLLNFELTDFIDKNGDSQPMYKITRDGFAFLAMGFTGKKAAQFKEAYITAFNQMEERLRSPVAAVPRTRILMAMDGDKVSSVQAVPYDSFIADCNSLADLFPNFSHQITPADLFRISQECMTRLAFLAGK